MKPSPNSCPLIYVYLAASSLTSFRKSVILTAVSHGVSLTALRGGGVVGLLLPPKLWYIPRGSSSNVDQSMSSAKGGVQQVSGSRYFFRFLCIDFIPARFKLIWSDKGNDMSNPFICLTSSSSSPC